jgi:hypothetical protein
MAEQMSTEGSCCSSELNGDGPLISHDAGTTRMRVDLTTTFRIPMA